MRSTALGSTLSMLALVGTAYGADGDVENEEEFAFDEIVVTANRRSQRLLEVPQSISALTGTHLEELGADNFSDYARFVPGLDFVEFSPGQTRMTIRGVSGEVGVSTVSYYIDEISITAMDQGAQPDFKMFDIERVEVLRGPQGTLYGEGSMGGTIRVITKKPNTTEFEGAVDATFGMIKDGGEDYSVSGMLNVPVVEDKLAIRAVGLYRDSGGWIDNILPGAEQEDTNSAETYAARVSARFQATDDLTITAMGIFNRLDTDNNNVVNDGEDVALAALNPRSDDYDLYSLTIDYDFGGFTLTSASSYTQRDTAIRYTDAPGTLAFFDTFFVPITGGEYSFTQSLVYIATDSEAFTQEVRLVSDNDSRLTWTLGGFYRDYEIQNSAYRVSTPDFTFGAGNLLGETPGELVPGGVFTSATTTKLENIAIFGEASYEITDKLDVTVGLRWFQEKQDIVDSTSGALVYTPASGFTLPYVLDNNKIDDFTPKATLSYTASENAMMFFTVARGYRSGGANLLADVLPNAQNRYKNDSTINYEVGGKFTLADGRLTVIAAAYYIDWKDLQISDFDANFGVGYISNAGSAHSAGLELEIVAQPTDRLTLTFAGNISEAELDEDIPGANFSTEGTIIESGSRLPNVPKYKFGGTAQYVYPINDELNMVFHGDVSFVGESFSRLEAGVNEGIGFGDSVQPSYAVGNVSVAVAAENWTATLFVENVWDEFAALGDDNFGGFHRNKPRTVGINLKYDF
ncbi:TonB-dependent receptor [Emcibacter nanhaiensis]|nr:TonB-dependent receptor [Emcibacter nanhaiensis]